jgi:hypothetical protein
VHFPKAAGARPLTASAGSSIHDMIAGGSPICHTPLYYTYGVPGSWDEY